MKKLKILSSVFPIFFVFQLSKFKFFLLATLYLLLATDLAFAQTPEWVYQYVHPSSSNEWPSAIAVDYSGNTYTTGVLSSDDTTGGHISGIGIIKLDTSGQEHWIYFNDTLARHAYGNDIAFNFNKGYIAGYAQFLDGNKDLIVLCVDTSGRAQWIYRDTVSFEANAVAVSQSQHVYVAGFTRISSLDIIALKLDSLGNEKWRYIYDGPAGSYDEAVDIAIDRDENIYVGGYSTGFGTNTDFTVVKLDSAGNEKWVYRYDGPAHARDEIETIVLDTAGNIYMAGNSAGVGWDICAIKIDSSGQEKWVYRYNGAANSSDGCMELLVDDTGNVYIAGHTLEDTVGLFTVIKIDSLSNEVWRYCSIGPWNEGGMAGLLAFDGLGAIYAAGSFTNLSNRGQIALVKLSLAGESLWTYVHPHEPIPPWSDGSCDLVADIAGNVYLAGVINVGSFDDDIVVMKFASSQGVVEEVSEKEKIRGNLQTSIFRKGCSFLASANSYLQVYDVLGRVIIKEVFHKNQMMYIKLQPGVYFFKVEENENKKIKKIIIL